MSLENRRRIFTADQESRSVLIKRLALITLVMIVIAGLWTAGLFWFVNNTKNFSTLHTGDTNADAIVVLTGGSNRIAAGFDLLEKGRGKKLFISGVYHGVEVAELLRLWKQIPDKDIKCCVVLGYKAGNTEGNANETVPWLKKEGYHSIYLVTSNYHMQRALLEFHAAAPDLQIIPYPVRPDGMDISKWWRHAASKNLVIREYTKYLFTLVRTSLDLP